MKVFSSVLAALQISSISADTFHIRTGNVVHGFKINGEAFGVWSGGNSKKITLRAGEKIESVEFSQCTWHDLYVISEMKFITNWKKEYGPYGVCGKKNKSPGWARYRQTFDSRHVRLDKLKQQVQMTSNKYNGNKYVKSFSSMPKPYVQNCNSGYSGCSKTCGGGTQTCQNTCVHSSFGSVTECPNNRRTSSRNSNQQACPTWNDWSEFGACSATCGEGTKQKTRTCQNGSVGQAGCTGDAVFTEPCNEKSCECPSGFERASDKITCVSIADADKHCPTSSCWTYENNPKTGKLHCKLKTEKISQCAMYLNCEPDIMDFRFNQASLLGENTVLINDESTCPIAASSGLIGTVAATGADKMWKHAPASCDSEVTRETKDDQEWIVVKKSFQWRGDNTAKAIGTAAIYLDDAATATIEICCRFLASHRATSDEIEIKEPNLVEGKMEAEGSWADSLAIEYTESTFTTKRPEDFVGLLGSTFYVRVTWSVGDAETYPMAAKLNWYVSDCTVSDVNLGTGKSVTIIEDQCFAGVLDTTKVSATMQSDEMFKFTYKSFSFNDSGGGEQKISCDIQFCLKDTECSTQTDLANLSCDGGSKYKWAKP